MCDAPATSTPTLPAVVLIRRAPTSVDNGLLKFLILSDLSFIDVVPLYSNPKIQEWFSSSLPVECFLDDVQKHQRQRGDSDFLSGEVLADLQLLLIIAVTRDENTASLARSVYIYMLVAPFRQALLQPATTTI